MSRDVDSTMAAALPAPILWPCILAEITFASALAYVWSGIGTLAYGGNNYLGVGSLGSISPISEGSDVKADGMSVTLSGIASGGGASSMLTDALTDIQIGAAANIWFGLLANGAIIGSPYLIFSGTVDKPTVAIDPDGTISITLALENKLVNLARAGQIRYTAAAQAIAWPTDIGFNWVEILNDIALRWGS